MNIIYKLIFCSILLYFLVNVIKENFQQNFTLPKVKIHQIEEEIKQNRKKYKYNIKQTLKSGQGVHDRIRFDGKWN
jgi:hypothetical protein